MPRIEGTLDLEELVISLYSALDDALAEAGVKAKGGKLIPRPGPRPDVDDREILCLAVLQEVLGFESDHRFHCWFEVNPTMQSLFPRRLSRPNWADRRALLTPLVQKLCQAFCALDGEKSPPFSLSIATPSMCAVPYERGTRSVWEGFRVTGIVRR